MSDEILWIGNASRLEFTRITDALRQNASLVECRDLSFLPAKVTTPSCVCLAAARPGEVSAQQLEQIRSRFPASTHITVLGELCCGLKRTRSFLDADSTFYAHELPSDVSLETLFRLSHSPLSVGLAQAEPKLVAIYSTSSSYQRGIAEALEEIPASTLSSGKHPTVLMSSQRQKSFADGIQALKSLPWCLIPASTRLPGTRNRGFASCPSRTV